MDHVAIMSAIGRSASGGKKSWSLIPKILSSTKIIESRWYQTEHLPWGKITAGDIVYFKNSGEPITLKAQVSQVLQFSDLTPTKIHEILNQYAHDDGITPDKINYFYNLFKSKKYCLLIFLKNPQKITPFDIDKRGFGAQAAWITIPDINQIKLHSLV
jgi:hypothetical protein